MSVKSYIRPARRFRFAFLELYVPDERHPSLAGTYLAACTVYASLLRKSPVGNAYTAGLPADVAAYLQQVAWETVEESGVK